MATRLQPIPEVTGPFSSIGLGSGSPWNAYDYTHQNIRYLSGGGGYNDVAITFAMSENSDANLYCVRTGVFVTDALSGAQTISGTLKVLMGALESSTSANFASELYARVVDSTGTVERGVLYYGLGALALTNEWPTTAGTIYYPAGASAGVTLSSVNAQDGDRILIEVGFRAFNTAFTTYTGTTICGGYWFTPDATAVSQSPYTNASWVEFSQNLVFRSQPAATLDIDVSPTTTGRVQSTNPLTRTGTLDIATSITNSARTVGTATYMPATSSVGVDLSAPVLRSGKRMPATSSVGVNLSGVSEAQAPLEVTTDVAIDTWGRLTLILPAPTPPAAPASPINSGGASPPAAVGSVPAPKIRRISETYPTPTITNGRPT